MRAHTKQVLGFRRSNFLLALYVLAYSVYLIAGGVVFATLEAPAERVLKDELAQVRTSFLEAHPCITDSALEELIEKVVEASNRGVSAAQNVSGEPNWSFGQSLFFFEHRSNNYWLWSRHAALQRW